MKKHRIKKIRQSRQKASRSLQMGDTNTPFIPIRVFLSVCFHLVTALHNFLLAMASNVWYAPLTHIKTEVTSLFSMYSFLFIRLFCQPFKWNPRKWISFFCALCFFQLILTHHFPFKLNAKVLQVLMSIFLYHDFSVRNFIKGVQVQSGFEILNPSCAFLQMMSADVIQTCGKQTLLCLAAVGPAGALSLSASQRTVL